MHNERILQITPADGTVAIFGSIERTPDGRQYIRRIAEQLPVICWALIDGTETYVTGMVANEVGEIVQAMDREDFAGYRWSKN